MFGRTIDVYVADLRNVATDEDLLSIEELGRALEIATMSPVLPEYLAARSWLRRRLSEYLDCPAEEIKFAFSDGDKPRVVTPVTDLTFNLSYSNFVAVLAVGFRTEVGVDIETTANVDLTPGEVAGVLLPTEQDRFERALNPVATYLRFRVRKQAVAKLVGVDIEQCMKTTDTAGLSPVVVDGYEITDLKLGDEFVASVAAPIGTSINLMIDDTIDEAATRGELARAAVLQ